MGLRLRTLLLATFTTLAFACDAKAQFNGNLIVDVNGLKDRNGLLCIKIFNGSQGFPNSNDRALKRDCVKITEEPMRFVYKGLTAGNYAVAVFHDSNGDRTLNRNSAGMPTEGYGFSRNPVVKTSAPKYGEAVFLLAGANTRTVIQMKYGN
ncbi:hypothetical protein OsccyDRAFT_2710 [Leptolyngbyaceae cyanobacterium JSC-12]|nr:hypothetical protein OsccyDRAFT_2710 [Leptolyngbyaceae cyanobacterium JSC-12]